MLFRKMLLLTIFLTLISTLIPINAASAQEGEVVTAEVVVDTLNVRYMPNAYRSADTLIGQLHRGDIVTVQYYESAHTWWSTASSVN